MSQLGKLLGTMSIRWTVVDIKVDNVERLVGNLCTLWIGRKHLQANVARFDRDSIPSKRVPHKFNHVAPTPTSFVSAVKGVSDRIVWVDIEGVPLQASHATFHKIGYSMGRGHGIREMNHCEREDDESVKNEADINVVDNTVNNEGEKSDSEAVSDTFFGDNGDTQEHDNEVDQTLNDKESRVLKEVEKLILTFNQWANYGLYMDGCTQRYMRRIIDRMEVMEVFRFIVYPFQEDSILIISGYAPQAQRRNASKCQLWDFILLYQSLNRECMVKIVGRFHEAVCLDRHLSDHRPILLWEMLVDFGATPFRLYHSCFSVPRSLIGNIVSRRKIRKAGLGMVERNKSPGPDDFTFEFLPYGVGQLLGQDFCIAVQDDAVLLIQSRLNRVKASVLVKGKSYFEFQFLRGLKQRPIGSFFVHSYYESLHLSLKTVLDMSINLKKVIFSGLGIRGSFVSEAAASLGCFGDENPSLGEVGFWRFLSQEISLWCQLISAIHGSSITDLSTAYPSTWNSIIKEFNYLKVQGVDVFSHCKIRIGNGLHTRFWKDLWIGDCTLSGLFPRLFALDTVKDISVACKLQSPLVSSFRRNVRGGIEEQQLEHLVALLNFVIFVQTRMIVGLVI
ncbi:hypothetical protein Tco_0823498 [Tanacetum coccineum]|uniref:Uncharacterized protein n=1 Tax=Tanacetum coccineum TaxID=301880 RepID=A0ABQ5AJV6_9ASTR